MNTTRPDRRERKQQRTRAISANGRRHDQPCLIAECSGSKMRSDHQHDGSAPEAPEAWIWFSYWTTMSEYQGSLRSDRARFRLATHGPCPAARVELTSAGVPFRGAHAGTGWWCPRSCRGALNGVPPPPIDVGSRRSGENRATRHRPIPHRRPASGWTGRTTAARIGDERVLKRARLSRYAR